MSAAFGRMVDKRAAELRLKDYQLQTAIGLLPDNKVFSAKQIGRLRAGAYRLVPKEVVKRLIEVLHLDPDDAWAAAGVLPPGIRAEDLRRLRSLRAASGPAAPASIPDSYAYPKLIRLPTDRRHSDRRRRRPLVASAHAA